MWRLLWLGALFSSGRQYGDGRSMHAFAPFHSEHPHHPHHHHHRSHHHHYHHHHRESPPDRPIIYPTVEQYDDCYVNAERTLKGACKRLSDCPKAVHRWHYLHIRPETCYFDRFEQYICCEPDEQPERDFIIDNRSTQNATESGRMRRSELACARDSGGNFPLTPAVVNGEPTAYDEFPYMAALGWRANYGIGMVYQCGGALISPTYVLTAAHCAERGGESPVTVRLGGTNLTDSNVRDLPIQRIIVHPSYNANATYHDIALVQLTESATATIACISPTMDQLAREVITIGYGHTKFAGTPSNQLLKATLRLVSNVECNRYYSDTLPQGVLDTQMCAKDPEQLRDSCQGDSGGPIVMRDSAQFIPYTYVLGITSFGLGCANTPPSVYTRVSAYIDWIEDIVWPANG